jgi:hypothetical protein
LNLVGVVGKDLDLDFLVLVVNWGLGFICFLGVGIYLFFGVWDLFVFWGLGFGVWGLGFGVWGLGFGVWA